MYVTIAMFHYDVTLFEPHHYVTGGVLRVQHEPREEPWTSSHHGHLD